MVLAKHGLMSFNIHPDYIIAEKARNVYRELLVYLSELRSKSSVWVALPKEVDAWWRMRSEMYLVEEGSHWRVHGPGRERARIAYAVLAEDKLSYEVE
jgi:hypothetical protein